MDYAYFHSILFAVLLASARLGGVLAILPPTQDSMITGAARRVLMLALCVPVIRKVQLLGLPELGVWPFVLVALKEVLIGFLLGFFVAMPFYLAENIGSIIDNQRGSTMSEVYSPLSGTQVSTTGIFISQILNVLFFVSGGFLVVLGAIYFSYDIWPIYKMPSGMGAETPQVVLGAADNLLSQTLVLAAPVLIVMFLATAGLGLVNRTAPQLNVFFLSMPVKSALGILMLVFYLQYLLEVLLSNDADRFIEPVRRIILP